MKELYKIGAYLAVLALAAGLWALFSPVASERQTASFLDAVVDQKYDKAALYYASLPEDDSGKWAAELRKLEQKEGLRLLSYDSLKADYDDGCYCTGHVNLTFEVQNKPVRVNAILTFGEENKPGQVCPIPRTEQMPLPGLDAWSRLVCGGTL